jgi:hypothetical protein
MGHPQTAEREDGFQIWRTADSILNMQLPEADKLWYFGSRIGRGATANGWQDGLRNCMDTYEGTCAYGNETLGPIKPGSIISSSATVRTQHCKVSQ